jgi:transposase
MKPYRYVSLSPSELETLEEGHRNGHRPHFRVRCHSLILSHRGMKVEEIATLYEKHEETIRTWMTNWETKGIAGLFIAKGQGKKPVLRVEDEVAVELVKKKSRYSP